MILIADSGSTKTDWCVAEQGKELQRVTTRGMNPFFQTEAEMRQEIKTALWPHLKVEHLDAVFFYGAGCTLEKQPLVRDILAETLPVATENVEVSSDMLGAARALCRREAGIACILGTGSNSCYYDGTAVMDNVSPLGFILGDEGSGAVLGKLLVGDVLKNQLTPALKTKFLSQYDLTPARIIERVYRQPFPNRFLAGLSPFLAENLHEPCIKSLVLGAFTAFLRRNVMQYDGWSSLPVHFIGSIAYHYEDVLREACMASGVRAGTILQSPMEGLVKFH